MSRSGLAPTGTLRAAINLGNPVLAQDGPDGPSGVTVDLARELASRLGVPLALKTFDAARHSFDALRGGDADIAFLAIEPARAKDVDFTAPYVVIEAVFVVPDSSPLVTIGELDRDDVRIGVKEGSAYDLFLSRRLTRATVVRAAEGVDAFVSEGLEAGAGIRTPVRPSSVDGQVCACSNPRSCRSSRRCACPSVDRPTPSPTCARWSRSSRPTDSSPSH